MKVLEIILLILIIIIIYPGINYLKKASEKVRKLGSPNDSPSEFTGSKYFDPNPVWSEDSQDTYTFAGGVSVVGSGICRVYTYEQPLVSQKTDSNGNFNLLSNVSYVKPNLNTALEDFVNGNSHLTGKIEDIDSGSEGKCIDIDQINTKYVKKTCEPGKNNSLNKCYDNQGNIIPEGESFSYNTDCAKSICPGEIGCISLNYSTTSGNISINTQCISIEGISIPRTLESIYNLDFYNLLGIINFDDSIDKDGPYPVNLKFNTCNNTDARQKFKILRFSGVGPSGSGVCTNLDHTLKANPEGSYASLIFRGLNSYLDSENGKFYLKPVPDDSITKTVKWIFFPETKISDKTVPSTQRCVALKSNIYPDPSILTVLKDAGIEGLTWGGINIITGGVTRLVSIGNFVVRVGGGISYFGGGAFRALTGEAGNAALDGLENFVSKLATGAAGIAKGGVDLAAELTEVILENFLGEEGAAVAIEAAVEIAAIIAAASVAVGEFIAGVLDDANPVLVTFALLSLLFSFLPDPTYDPDNPISIAGAFTKGQKVSPTNFLSDVLTTGPGSPGEANVTPLEKFCVNRKLDTYPPYFLEAISDGTIISKELINYQYKAGYHISGRKVLTFGTAKSAYGLFIWKKPNNKTVSPINSVWKDGDTTWLVKSPLSESVAYFPSYFKDDKSSSVLTDNSGITPLVVSPTDGTNHNTSEVFSRLTPFNSGLIKVLKTNSEKTIKEVDNPTRFTGNYIQVDSTTNKSGKDATFNVIVSNFPTSPVDFSTKISSLTINQPGQNYSVGDEITIPFDSIGGSSAGSSLSFGVSTVATEVFIFKAATQYTYTGKTLGSIRVNGNSYWYLPESDPGDVYEFVNGGFEIISTYSKDTNLINFKSTTNSAYYTNMGITSGGTGYKLKDPIYLIQYDINGRNLQISGDKSVLDPNSTNSVNTDLCLQVNVNQLQESGYAYNLEAPGSLLSPSLKREDFYLEYNFMDNADNVYNPCPQQIVYGAEANPEGNLISYLSSTIKGNLKPKDIQEAFLSESLRDQNTGLLNTGNRSILNLKSIQVDRLGYKVVDVEDLSSIEEEDIQGSNVVLKKFIPYSSFAPAYFDQERIKDIETKNLPAILVNQLYGPIASIETPILKYGVSTFFYNQNYAQIIPYGIPDVYNNSKFIENAPKF